MLRSALFKCAFYGVVLTLAACGSSVKLSDVPVEDRTGTSAGAGAAAGGAGAGARAGFGAGAGAGAGAGTGFGSGFGTGAVTGAVTGAGTGAIAGGPISRSVAPVSLAPVSPASAVQAPTDMTAQGLMSGPRVIYFDFDSFSIKPEYQPVIDVHANFLNANKTRRVTLEGHTDESGGREYNLALGQKRAEAVRRSLVLKGVSESQVEPVSFVEEKPSATGLSEADLAKNRRAEIVYR